MSRTRTELRSRGDDHNAVAHPDCASTQNPQGRACPAAQRLHRTRADPVGEKSAGRRVPHDFELRFADLYAGAGRGRNIACIDGDVPTGRMGVELVAEILGGSIQRFPGLQGDLPVPAAVIAVADQTFARLGDDGIDRTRRDPTAGRDVNGNNFPVLKSMCGLYPELPPQAFGLPPRR